MVGQDKKKPGVVVRLDSRLSKLEKLVQSHSSRLVNIEAQAQAQTEAQVQADAAGAEAEQQQNVGAVHVIRDADTQLAMQVGQMQEKLGTMHERMREIIHAHNSLAETVQQPEQAT